MCSQYGSDYNAHGILRWESIEYHKPYILRSIWGIEIILGKWRWREYQSVPHLPIPDILQFRTYEGTLALNRIFNQSLPQTIKSFIPHTELPQLLDLHSIHSIKHYSS